MCQEDMTFKIFLSFFSYHRLNVSVYSVFIIYWLALKDLLDNVIKNLFPNQERTVKNNPNQYSVYYWVLQES